MADFLEDTRTQEELDQMFSAPAVSRGEVVPQGRPIGGTDMTITDTTITAVKVQVARDDGEILRRLASVAAYAGAEVLTYSWPVKERRTGKVKIVEGPTIKAANALLRCYRNAKVDIASVEYPGFWIFKATFIDYEAGISLSRLFQQDKGTVRLGGEDGARRLDMAYQLGQSKAERNVIVNFLELPYVDYLVEQAKQNLVGRVSKNIDAYRERIRERLAELGVEVQRVERTVGKPLGEWLARDVARVIQEIKAVQDGMAFAADTWPLPAPPEPRRSDAEPAPEPTDQQKEPPRETEQNVASEEAPVRNWRVPDDLLGQDAIIKALRDLLGMVESAPDLERWEQQNAPRLSKLTGQRKLEMDTAINEKRREVS
jgi:hypothetical protein